jgi:UDP-N-acetylmuramoyl-L-alanyl-D-glutamate--2,6-diaminopimelate ligase
MYHYDSRKVKDGDTFICLPGGELYVEEAMSRGAVAVKKMDRKEMALLARDVYGRASEKMTVIGVTGTNGKTTTTHLIHQGLKTAGYQPYILGTLNAGLTTPESLDINRAMAAHLDAGGTHFVMEVSSHAIVQHRVAEIDFDIKLLTNITQDHLDYHGTLEAYKRVKMAFMSSPCRHVVFPETFAKENLGFTHGLQGRFNLENMKAAVSVLRLCGVLDAVISEGMGRAIPPPGRFEVIDEGQPYMVIVDYAHTPDGLENILAEARYIADRHQARVLALFGCGGERDRDKRPKMGRVVSELSDESVVTTDNPRGESVAQIMTDILSGMAGGNFSVIEDRKRAISHILSLAKENDVVVLAGKGHETEQVLASGPIQLDDRSEARRAIQKLQGERP